MTHYATELVRYVAQFGRLSEEEAIEKLNAWASSTWQTKNKAPHADICVLPPSTDND